TPRLSAAGSTCAGRRSNRSPRSRAPERASSSPTSHWRPPNGFGNAERERGPALACRAGDARWRIEPGPRVPRGARRAPLHREGRRRARLGRGRASLHRPDLLVGPACGRTRASRGGRGDRTPGRARHVIWHALAAARRTAAERDLAAIIVEPVAGNMGAVPPESGFLEGLRLLATECGALLIFDEVITGFRLARGGAQERLGIAADITCLGKIIGGGLPVGAYGARRELMRLVAPEGPVYQAGTLSGNPLAMAAGLATLGLLDAAAYERLEALGGRLARG